jgi:hypothetical protein
MSVRIIERTTTPEPGPGCPSPRAGRNTTPNEITSTLQIPRMTDVEQLASHKSLTRGEGIVGVTLGISE